MNWVLTDRVTRVNFFAALVVAGFALWPVLQGQPSLIMMAAVLMLVYQAWRLAMAREVYGELNAEGVAKVLGTRERHIEWSEIRAARLMRFLGSEQLVVTLGNEVGWTASDRLYGRLGRHEFAVQVPSAERARLVEIFAAHDLVLA